MKKFQVETQLLRVVPGALLGLAPVKVSEKSGAKKPCIPWDPVYNPYHAWDWYIYLHLVDFYGKCRETYHTWIVLGNSFHRKTTRTND